MPKLRLSFDSITHTTFEIDEQNTVGEPHLVISREGVTYRVTFVSDEEHKRFCNGGKMCKAKYEGGEIWVTGF